jgi:NAD(P)-dependent dehydrogenase (short-subunit alcohol dehydrogenase family)
MNLSTATAFVTGGNRGIGRAIVDRLLAEGAVRVYATARSAAEADKLSEIDQRVIGLVLDTTDGAKIAAAAEKARDVTLLINNAGVIEAGSFLEATQPQVERNFATNFYGTLAMTRAFTPILAGNGGGTIVNMLTIAALAPIPGMSAYNASKAAAWSMTQSLRATLASKGIKVMGVFPGPVDTQMLAGIPIPKAAPSDVAEAIVAGIASDVEDVFPDDTSSAIYSQWTRDHKSIERQMASM